MSAEGKRYYIELLGYILIVVSIILSLVSASLAYNPAGADPFALPMVLISAGTMVTGIIIVRLIPWREPAKLIDKVDDDEFVF